jgi:hypothetical protein
VPITVNGRTRIPDFNPHVTMRTRDSVVEVKDVKRIYASSQLRDLHAYATARNKKLELFTNARIPPTGNLARWKDAGTLVVHPIP